MSSMELTEFLLARIAEDESSEMRCCASSRCRTPAMRTTARNGGRDARLTCSGAVMRYGVTEGARGVCHEAPSVMSGVSMGPVYCSDCGAELTPHCDSKACAWMQCEQRGCEWLVYALDTGVRRNVAGNKVERLGAPPEAEAQD